MAYTRTTAFLTGACLSILLTACIGPRTGSNYPTDLAYEDQSWKSSDNKPLAVGSDMITIEPGNPYSGATWTGPFPTDNYELSLEATRLEGQDIFCGIVFPIREDTCSLILGGWDNSLLGMSMIDGLSAAENVTSYPESFTNHTWSTVVLKVTSGNVSVTLNEKTVIDLQRDHHTFSLYPGLEMYEPFGFFTYNSKALIRNPTLRMLKP